MSHSEVIRDHITLRSAAIEDETGYNPDSHHWLRTLTIHNTNADDSLWPGVPPESFFVVLQRCDGNLKSFVHIARGLRQATKQARASAAAGLESQAATTPFARAAKAWSLPSTCFQPAYLVGLCRQQLQAVAFLHEAGRGVFCPAAHGNLKPSNVLLRNGMVKLAEFDCAPVADAQDEHTLRTGVACGQHRPISPWHPYMGPTVTVKAATVSGVGASPDAPPHLPMAELQPPSGEEVPAPHSGRSAIGNLAPPLTEHSEVVDCFALGCLVYYTLTLGQHPFGQDAPEQVQRIRLGSAPQLETLSNKNTPAALEGTELVQQMLTPPPQLTQGGMVRRCLAHPLFWGVQQKFQLICGVSEGLEVNQNLVPNVHQRAFATDIQRTFTQFLNGDTTWAGHMAAPAAMGPDGWNNSRLWPFKSPALYEATYAGPFNMYSLVRFVRNMFVHGASHVRVGVFASVAHITEHVLQCFPWLPLALWQVDELHGGHFTQEVLSVGNDHSSSSWRSVSVASAAEAAGSGNDSDTPLVMVSHKRLMADGSVAAVLPPKHSPQQLSSAAAGQPPVSPLSGLGAPLHTPNKTGAGAAVHTADSSDSDGDAISTRFFLPSARQHRGHSGRKHATTRSSRRRRRRHPRGSATASTGDAQVTRSSSQPQSTRRRGRRRMASI